MSKPELSDPITLRLPVEILREIEQVAEALDRTRSWVMVRALRRYLASEGLDIVKAIEGKRQIETDRSHDLDVVMREIEMLADGKAA